LQPCKEKETLVTERSIQSQTKGTYSSSSGDGLFARWARFAVRRRRRVLGGWVVAIALLVVLSSALGGSFVNDFTVPDTESQRAADLLEQRFPAQAGDNATLVVQADAGIADPAIKTRVEALLAQVAELPEVTGVVSPFENPTAISADGTIAYATIQYDKTAIDVDDANISKLTDLVDRSAGDGLRVEVGGQIVSANEEAPQGQSEMIGIAAAVIILLIAFGSVVAMGLPIATALFGLLAGFLGISLATSVLDISTFTPAFAAMIGIGVGIDYSLFIVTRFREGLHAGLTVEDAVARAIDSSGRAVAFAGTVVAIALLGLFAIGIPALSALGTAAAIVVVFCVLVALTLLPALLGFAGHRIDRWRIPGLHTVGHGGRESVWYRWSRQVQGKPLRYLLASAVLLLALTIPVLDLRLGFSDAGNNPASLHSRRAYDLLATGFGPGFNGPLIVVVEQDGGIAPETLQRLTGAMRQSSGVAKVDQPIINPTGDTAVISVIPTTSPQDAQTPKLVKRLRDDVIPPTLNGTGGNAYVAGATASLIDTGNKFSARLPYFFAIVIGLSFLLLTMAFRSIVIPLKAALMNLLSIGATFGLLVAVFQWGWLGIAKEGPIESFLPMMLFAILFGLSMDYEMFLLSRIREDYVRTGDTGDAVAHGLSATARVIAAAAAIMVAVFLSFGLSAERSTREFGLGLATAVFIDATIVRLVLVPSTMELLGRWNWWWPSWLDRLMPRLNIEGARVSSAAEGD
jgi:RND superfamily putative drug exporter